MRIFLAGATGALGKRLVPRLIEAGHTVVGTTRSEERATELWDLGAKPIVADALDRDAVVAAVVDARPDAIVHQLTALSGADFRRFRKSFELTNRLRTDGTDNLLAAAQSAGVERFVAQSYAGWPYARTGGAVKREEDPLDPEPAPQMAETLAAIRYLEERVVGADGIVLRYGGFYGPGTGLEPAGEQLEAVRERRFPIVGGGRAVWSFVHIDDAAAATVAALERGHPGVYNIVDDEPAPVADWLPYLAEIAGAKPPRRLPSWLGRLAGKHLVVMMDEARGASNEKARRELGWMPRHPTWRDGFREAL
ncbi:MAG: NAD-dependent epimerase/dehydratase family protein [Thermoleophilaceae bacterium]